MAINTYPRWKYLLLACVLVLGLLYAIPNLYGDDPAVQVIANHHTVALDSATLENIESALAQANIPIKAIEQEGTALLLRFPDTTEQLKAKDLLRDLLDHHYMVALNLAPATPAWLEAIGAKPVKLGLDLRGGVHFLMEVDVQTALSRRQEGILNDMRAQMRDEKSRYQVITRLDDGAIFISFENAAMRDQALTSLKRAFRDMDFIRDDERSGPGFVARLSPIALQEARNYTVEQTITTLRNRINELGVAEAVVQRQGLNRVVVELPGIQDTARAKDILGKTATLEFRMKDEEHDARTATAGQVPAGSQLYHDRYGQPVLLKKRVILTGDSITGATTSTDSRDGRPTVGIRLGGVGVNLFKKVTRESVGKAMGVLYIETRVSHELIDGEMQKKIEKTEEVISVATIQSALGTNFQITNLGVKESQDLALLLRAGALPATVSIVEERTVGPSLGQQNIEMGVRSIQIGLALVVLSMLLYYSVFGLIANITLVINLVLLLAILSIMGATLTLPGIAGIVLTLGMAVDANVLIFERIREEMRNGVTQQACIHGGFERALATIIDSNLTTLIVGVILFSVGTGPVRGFAVTLSIGILTSLLTAITGTRAMVNLVYGGNTKRPLRIGI